MSLRFRLIRLSVLWIFLILALFNVFIYIYFQRQTTNAEVRMLWNKAQIILRNPDVHNPQNWTNRKLLNEFAAENTLVRIITPQRDVPLQYVSNERLGAYPVVYRTSYHTAVRNEQGFRMLFIQVPIRYEDRQVGVLELGKALDLINFLMDVLATGLAVTTVSVMLFSIVGGLFYTRVLIKPLRELVDTMNTIRSKGDFVLLGPKWTTNRDELGKLGQTFNDMIGKLQENDRKQKHFVACASHELKTPLTVIESYASLLKRWGGENEAVRSEATEAILSEAARLKELTLSLLRLAELEQEGEMRPMEEVELAELVRQTAAQLAQATGRPIRVVCSERAIAVDGYPEELKQLLIILLDNAVKYSEAPVEVVLERDERTALLLVKDRGIGIPEAELPHLFERFYRVDPARVRPGGSGLGLSIARPIAERHNGTIQLASREGKGTTAVVRLPLSDQK